MLACSASQVQSIDDSNGDDDEIACFIQRLSGNQSHGDDEIESQSLVFGSTSRRRHAEWVAVDDENERAKRQCNESTEHQDQIEHPLTYNSTSISFVGESRYKLTLDGGAAPGSLWYTRILERFIDAGYAPRNHSLSSEAAIANVFQSLPDDLAAVIQDGLRALSVLSASRRRLTPQPPCATAANDAATAADAAWDAREDELWAARDDCGYLRFDWDPATEYRRGAAVNAALARMQGLHLEELVRRGRAGTRAGSAQRRITGEGSCDAGWCLWRREASGGRVGVPILSQSEGA